MKYVSVEENTQPKTIIFRFINSWKLFVGLENSDQNLIIRVKTQEQLFLLGLLNWLNGHFLLQLRLAIAQKVPKPAS